MRQTETEKTGIFCHEKSTENQRVRAIDRQIQTLFAL